MAVTNGKDDGLRVPDTPLALFPLLYAAGAGTLGTALYLLTRGRRWGLLWADVRRRQVDLAPVPFLAAAILSSLFSREPRLAWGSTLVILVMLVTYWLFMADLRRSSDTRWLLHYWTLGATVLAVLGINGWIASRTVADAAWLGKNGAATMLAASLPLVQVYAAAGHDRGVARLAVVGVPVALAGTLSLGGWVAAVVSQAWFLTRVRWRKTAMAAVLVVAAALLAMGLYARLTGAPAYGLLASRFDPFGQSKVERVLIWRASWAMWKDHPWFGVGVGAFSAAYPSYRLAEAVEPSVAFAHNLLLNTLAETGLVGLAGLLFMLGTWCVRAWRAAQDCSDSPALAWAVLASLVAILVHQLFDGTVWSLQGGVGLWILGAWGTHLATASRAHAREVAAGSPAAMRLASGENLLSPHAGEAG